MGTRLRSWWQQMKRPPSVIVIIAVSVLLVALIVIEVRANGTGFAGKTLWDWLQLLAALAIPVVVGFGAVWFTAQQNHDREIALDNQRETMLQMYLDRMSELILHENLQQSKFGDEVASVAHARTLTVLPKLDPNRKASIILFLAESFLIERKEWIIDMSFADLRKVNLSQAMKLDGISLVGAYLQGANLSRANLRRANLRGVNLRHANLSGTGLREADLTDADLTGADLTGAGLIGVTGITIETLKKQAKSLKGATMPDGKIHD